MTLGNENTCAFYASDYHLEMIMLPYINDNLKADKNIYIFTQNNLEETIKTLVEKVNLKNETKQNILNLNWKNEDENKYNQLITENKKTIIFIKGTQEYIEKTNKNLNQIKELKDIEIVDCYDLNDVENDSKKIIKEHKKILVTKAIN